MTTIALDERWDFAGIDLATFARHVRSVEGADDLPPLRGEHRAIPGIDGRDPYEDEFDERTLGLVIDFAPADENGALVEPTEYAQMLANWHTFVRVAASRTLQTLGRTRAGVRRTADARVIEIRGEQGPTHVLRTAGVRWALPNPWFYGADVADLARPIAASPTDFTLDHPGQVATHRAVLDFTGPITNPRVTNLTTGVYVECLVAVPAGQNLVLDCEHFTALLNAVNAIGSVRFSGATKWMVLAPGANNLRVTGSAMTAATRLSTTFPTPYL